MIPFNDCGTFRPVAEQSELRRLAVRGAAATVTGSALALVAQVVSTVILARLLTPADFGVVTMVTTFSMLLMSFGQNGFEELVIQRSELNRFQASNLFWINCGIGFILALGFAGSGSLLARFYGVSQLTRITIAISPSIFIAAISVVHIALMKRAMRFTNVAANDVAARVVQSVVAIVLAWAGWGYWALVVAIIASVFSLTFGAWRLCHWIPSLPRRGQATRAMLKFAASVNGRFTANYFARNVDNVLVGWWSNATALGFYKKAYDLFTLSASQLTTPVANVALAALSRLSHDHSRLRRYLASSLGAIAFISMAVSADLTLVGNDVVRVVLGPKWAESGRIFQLFGPGIGILMLYGAVGWIHLSIGRPDRWLRWTVFEMSLTVLFFLIALPWGPAGVAVAWTVSYWILAIPAFHYAGRPIGFDVSYFIGAVWRYIAAALSAAIACTAVTRGTLGLTVASSAFDALEYGVLKSLLFVIFYLCAVVLLHKGFEPLIRFGALFRDVLPKPGLARGLTAFARTSVSDSSSSHPSTNQP